MSYEFEYLMHLAASAAHGTAAQPPKQPLDWERLAKLAGPNCVLPLVGCALKQNPQLGCPEKLKAQLEGQMLRKALWEIQRRRWVFSLLADMEAAGISAVLLKGFDAARAYAAPECRVSVDVDLWVGPQQEKAACDFLRAAGCAVQPRWEHGHHAVCMHPRMGCVELHTLLYDEIVEEIWFGKTDGREFVAEPRRRWDSEDGSCWLLGLTDDLIFTSLHMIKHFIQGSAQLRMLLDVALFIQQNRAQLDMERFWTTMASLHYDRLMRAFLWATVEHLGVSAENIPGLTQEGRESAQAILDDLEKLGEMTAEQRKAQEDGWHEYTRQAMLRSRTEKQYRAYMLRWRLGDFWHILFPSRVQLEKRYPWLAGSGWKLPAAWICWLGVKAKRLLHGAATERIVTDVDALSESARERIRLFQSLDML